jgi:hypothetical protein
MSICTLVRLASLVVLLATMAPISPRAQEPEPTAAAAVEAELTPEEKAERESRKACKVAICSAFHNRKPEGGDIACNVVKTWRKEQLEKMVAKAKVSWPWGRVKCVVDIKLKREMLIKAMTEPKYEAALDRHTVVCAIERNENTADIKFDFTPKVTFERGKAVKAALNWGHIAAPSLVKGAMWTVTATDNTLNVLQATAIADINDFIESKCLEVKQEWQGR